jgi:DNA-binding beta-propeller fold protein YncE
LVCTLVRLTCLAHCNSLRKLGPEYGNDRIQKFDSNGNFITKWGFYGTSDGQFDRPEGIAIDSSGNVYVADYWSHRIQVFAPKV